MLLTLVTIAYRPISLLANTPIEFITVKLPDRVDRSKLSPECFATHDENDTTLRPGVLLSQLAEVGSDDRHPLIIESAQQGMFCCTSQYLTFTMF